jgi:LPXTG-motif cell wall-anchored protein
LGLNGSCSGYTCTNTLAQTCISTASSASSAVFSAVSCESGTSGSVSSYTLPITIGTGNSVAIISTYIIYASLIQINRQSSDLLATTTTPSSISSLPSTTSTSATSTSQPQSGLSTGAQAGLGVGISLGVVVVALLLFFLYRRRKHNYAPTEQPLPTEPSAHELNGASDRRNHVYELPDTTEAQRRAPGRISELGG